LGQMWRQDHEIWYRVLMIGTDVTSDPGNGNRNGTWNIYNF
jgi:hypothetical protein